MGQTVQNNGHVVIKIAFFSIFGLLFNIKMFCYELPHSKRVKSIMKKCCQCNKTFKFCQLDLKIQSLAYLID